MARGFEKSGERGHRRTTNPNEMVMKRFFIPLVRVSRHSSSSSFDLGLVYWNL
jgi:hypothetical protein